jgi:hypothetical protein
MTQLRIYQKMKYLLPMHLTQVSAMEWSLKHLNESQLSWLARRNWDISNCRPYTNWSISDPTINRHFCIVTEIQTPSDLSFAQLLFADCHLETV